MSGIIPLSPSDRELLVRLPWRVGMWVSSSDDQGGDAASAAEAQALASIIVGFVEDSCKGELVQRLMEETVARRSEWPSWSEDLEAVPEECRIAVDSLSSVMPARDLASFKANMIEIGVAVASAWSERPDRRGPAGQIADWVRSLFSRHGIWPFSGGAQSLDFGDAESISFAERAALNRLAHSLEYFQGA